MTEARRIELQKSLSFQFNVPVRFADELVPALDAIHALRVNRLPVRTDRLYGKRPSWAYVHPRRHDGCFVAPAPARVGQAVGSGWASIAV
jgi:hypothetical protein